jgi:DNA polymerase
MTTIMQNNILSNLESLKYMGYRYIDNPVFSQNKTIDSALPNELEKLKNIVLNCNLCSLRNSRKSILFGEGFKNAQILFLGLHPSNLDDEKNKLLTGQTGKMIINMCQNILHIPIEKVYVLNILKCTPKLNSQDLSNEIKICTSYTLKQIEIINPKIIIAFGQTYEYLLNNNKHFNEVRGIIQQYNDIDVMSTYDPSYILRNPSYKKYVLEDLKKIKNLMEIK